MKDNGYKFEEVFYHSSLRNRATGMFNCSRYFATVRRAKLYPFPFNNCTSPKTVNAAISENIIYTNPRFDKNGFKLSKKSKLKGKANDGGNIGLK